MISTASGRPLIAADATSAAPYAPSAEEWAALRRGAERFHERDWFEAHEEWEEAWHKAAGPGRDFLQVMIQVAVVLEHVRRRNLRGARRTFQRAQRRGRGLPRHMLGVDRIELMRAAAVATSQGRDPCPLPRVEGLVASP